MQGIAWQTPVVGVLLIVQFAIAQALAAEPNSGFVVPPLWKFLILPVVNFGVGYALNQLKPIGASAVVRSVAIGFILGTYIGVGFAYLA